MAILSAAELKASREAIEADVASVSDAAAESAIALAEATMNRILGYKVANAATTLTLGAAEGERLSLSERVRTISAITEAYAGGSATSISDTYEIRGDGFALWRQARWRNDSTVVITGTFGFATTDDEYVLAKHFVLLAAVRYLQKTSSTDDFPAPAGALLTSYSSQSAQFTFFTPTEGSLTGYQDLDVLLNQIGKHPNKSGGLYTVSVSGGFRDITVDQVFQGLETPDDL